MIPRTRSHRNRARVPTDSARYVVTSIGINGPAQAVVGDVIQLVPALIMRANLVPGITNDVDVAVTPTWDTNNHGFATVDSSGLLTVLGAGAVTVSCAAQGVTGTLDITITGAVPVLASIVVSCPTDLTIGVPAQATAQGFDANNFPVGITPAWTSTQPIKATVNSATGQVMPVAAGNTHITATVGAISGFASVDVLTPTPTLVSMIVSPDNAQISPLGTQQFSVVGTYSDATQQVPPGVVWSCSAGASIGASSGLLTAGGSNGTITVTATVGAVSDNATLSIVTAGAQPLYADPVRLGADKIKGTNFSPLSVGLTTAEIKALMGAEGQLAIAAYPYAGGALSGANIQEGQLLCIANGAFGKVMRIVLPAYGTHQTPVPMSGNVELSMKLTSGFKSDWFFRFILRWVGNGNVNGTAPYGYPTDPKYPAPAAGYYSSFGTHPTGGSPTHKFGLSFPNPNPGGTRFQDVIVANGSMDMGFQHGESPPSTFAIWTGPGTAPNNPQPSGQTTFPFGFGAQNTWRGDNEFYEIIQRYKTVTSTSYYQAYFCRKLTSGNGEVLLASPGNWEYKGGNITNGVAHPYSDWEPIGNKSSSNDGPNDMFIDVAACEVVEGATLIEPYVTLAGHGNHL